VKEALGKDGPLRLLSADLFAERRGRGTRQRRPFAERHVRRSTKISLSSAKHRRLAKSLFAERRVLVKGARSAKFQST